MNKNELSTKLSVLKCAKISSCENVIGKKYNFLSTSRVSFFLLTHFLPLLLHHLALSLSFSIFLQTIPSPQSPNAFLTYSLLFLFRNIWISVFYARFFKSWYFFFFFKDAAYREHPRYRDGFNDCINEVNDYLSKKDCINTEFSMRVINHLNNRYNHKSKTLKQESPNRLNNPDINTKQTEQISPMIDCKSLKGLPFNQSISVSNDGLDVHPRSLCVVNSRPSTPAQVQAVSMDPQMITGHRSVQFQTNSPQQRNQIFCEMNPKHSDHNESQMMDISSNEKKTIVRSGPTAVDIAEIIRNGGQMIGTDSNNGMPIAFLVTTPLAIKAIPLYTSVDQPQKLATLSPTGTIVATPSCSPISGLPQTPHESNIDSFEMKTDGNISDSPYSTTDEVAPPPNTSLHNVWRPWNTQENWLLFKIKLVFSTWIFTAEKQNTRTDIYFKAIQSVFTYSFLFDESRFKNSKRMFIRTPPSKISFLKIIIKKLILSQQCNWLLTDLNFHKSKADTKRLFLRKNCFRRVK